MVAVGVAASLVQGGMGFRIGISRLAATQLAITLYNRSTLTSVARALGVSFTRGRALVNAGLINPVWGKGVLSIAIGILRRRNYTVLGVAHATLRRTYS